MITLSFRVGALIFLPVALVVFVATIPFALNGIFGNDLTGWDYATRTMWVLLPLVVIAVVFRAMFQDVWSNE